MCERSIIVTAAMGYRVGKAQALRQPGQNLTPVSIPCDNDSLIKLFECNFLFYKILIMSKSTTSL